jgi:hypothetical protein
MNRTTMTVLVALMWSSSAVAGNGIVLEWVDDYSDPTCVKPSLINDQANVAGLINNMNSGSGVSWPLWVNWGNQSVWDRDFVDSDLAASGQDNVGFDPPGAAISMFSGHGTCNDFNISGNTCSAGNASSRCTTPNVAMGQSTAAVSCTKGPNRSTGTCLYRAPKSILTCSSSDAFGHAATFSNGLVRFGESATSGGWAGAGTNGGVNFAILDISCPVRPGLEGAMMWNAFAGVHSIATIMPTTWDSDTRDDGLRGFNFARGWRANNNSSIVMSWLNGINNDPFGGRCNGTSSGYGGIGAATVNGCGAYWAGTVAQSQAYAQLLNSSETWVQAQNDNADPTGAAWMSVSYMCNYDCVANPINI